MSESNPNNSGRDARGRFGPGNPGGPGGSRKRELRRAIDGALSPDHLVAMLHKATRKGLEGDLNAIRLVFEQTVGRPRQAAADPEALDIKIPDTNTWEECGRAVQVVIVSFTSGKLNKEAAETLLDGIKTRMKTIRAAEKERDDRASRRPGRRISKRVLRALFSRFKKTGDLPEDVEEAAAVVDQVVAGFNLIEPTNSSTVTIESIEGFVEQPRPKAENMNALLSEAVYGAGLIKIAARILLKAYAMEGLDVTTDLLSHREVPEFGPVSWHITGLTTFILHGRHKAQAKRLFKRIEAARLRQAPGLERARERLELRGDAITCFTHTGERPDDPEIFEAVLLVTEFTTLLSAACGRKEANVLKLFDAVARKTGEEREQAITKLQELARAGRLLDAA